MVHLTFLVAGALERRVSFPFAGPETLLGALAQRSSPPVKWMDKLHIPVMLLCWVAAAVTGVPPEVGRGGLINGFFAVAAHASRA